MKREKPTLLQKVLSVAMAALLVLNTSSWPTVAMATDEPDEQPAVAESYEEGPSDSVDEPVADKRVINEDAVGEAVGEEPLSDVAVTSDEPQLEATKTEDPASAADPAPVADPVPAREAETFDANDYVKNLKFSLRAGDVSKAYELKAGETVDTRADFPDGLPRSAQYSAELNIDTKAMLEAQGKYPFVVGDKVTVRVPDLIRTGGATSGRLRDDTAEWDSANNGVGNYEVTKDAEGHNILTITYDEGYITEKSGKILASSVKLSGGFDTSKKTTEAFDATLSFGNLNVVTQFSKLEIIRNLSIEKTCAKDDPGPSSGWSSSPYYPRDGGASLDSDGFLTYTVTVKAGDDNTYKLTNVEVTDVFDDASKAKVDPSTMKLVSVVNDGVNTTASAVALNDASGNINGWNIGDLAIGTTATVTFKVKLNKDGVTAAVDAAKAADPSSDAAEARTLKNTASVKADDADPVSADCSAILKNYIDTHKSTGAFDSSTQRQHFTIRISAPSDNRYTQHDVPVYDYVTDGLDASFYKSSGVQSVTIKHADGTTETVECQNYSQAPDSRSWYATIPEMRPGDTATIDAFLELDESYWNNPAGAGRAGCQWTQKNYVSAGNVGSNGYYSADLNKVYAQSYFTLVKEVLGKNSPNINSDGTVDWVITGNESGKTREQENIGGLVLNDVLGPNQEFMGNAATVTFYNEDGSRAGTDLIELPAGSTSFSYTIPAQYGTCSYKITYKSKITDWESYVGPAKKYTNTVNGVTGATSERARVAAMTKKFVEQGLDWSSWKTSIYSELEDGDTYVDSSRGGVSYMYFTQEDLDGIALTIDDVTVDASLYEVEPVQEGSKDGKYASYKITFKGDVAVSKDGATVKPSKDHPLVVSYRAHMVNPSSGKRDYYNDATLRAGNAVDEDYDFCRRNKADEVRKTAKSSANGYVTWEITANYWGYSGQPDGTCVVTDTLPAGLTFESAAPLRGPGQIDSVTTTPNEDGTTTVAINLSGLKHDEVCKDQKDSNGSYEFHFTLKTKITDPEFLYGSESKTFNYRNDVSLTDRYGNLKTDYATTNVKHVAMKKTMVYDQATAPYAEFSIEANKDKLDLNPDGDTLGIVDESSKTLAVDLKSIEVVNALTGDPVDFTVDASKMANNQFTVNVPDNTYVKITYKAQVLGPVGSDVNVSNSAYYEGHRATSGESTIEKTVSVLNASGMAESEPMVWLSKKDEAAKALAGATYRLDEYDEATQSWKTIRPAIETTGNNNAKGVKVESLEINKLYRFVETQAPAGYVLDATPRYFVLYKDAAPTVAYPDGVDPDDVFQGPSGSLISAYNKPYTPVRFTKTSDDGVQLAGAEFTVYAVAEDGVVSDAPATDEAGNQVVFASLADAANVFSLAPGSYQLKETKAPAGYETADPVTFEVRGDVNRTVLINGQATQSGTADAVNGGIGVSDKTMKTSLQVSKAWDDCADFDGVRPQTVTVQLFADGEAVAGKTAELTADNGWVASFDDLAVMRAGKQVSYTVKEVDPETGDAIDSGATLANGYTVTVGNTTGDVASGADANYGVEITNSYAPKTTSVNVSKAWDDANNQDGVRPQSVTVQLYADGEAVAGKTVELAEDNGWSASFDDLLAAKKDGSAVVYTVKEIDPATNTAVDFGAVMANGYVPQVVAVSYAGYPAGVNPTDSDDATVEVAGDAQQSARSVSYSLKNVREVDVTAIKVTKKWVGPAAEAANVKIQVSEDQGATWTDVENASATLGEGNGWSATFEGLPVCVPGQQGAKRAYRVVEEGIDNYEAAYLVNGQVSDGVVEPVAGTTTTVAIANTNVEKTEVSGTKVWDDAGNQDGVRPQSITVRLLADGEEVETRQTTAADAKADDPNAWSFSFVGLPKYDPADGHEYVYTVEEAAVPEGYEASVEDLTITNAHEPAATSIEVTKQWIGPAADSATVRLQVSEDDGATWNEVVDAEVVLDEGNDWSAALEGLPVFAPGKQGVKLAYRVVEDGIDNYEAAYLVDDEESDGIVAPEADGTAQVTVINTNVEKTEISVTKVWDDGNNFDGARPQSIAVRLLADGEEVETREVSAADANADDPNAWSFLFTDLPKYDPADGHEYAYTVEEAAVPEGYTAQVAGDAAAGFCITNHKPVPPAAPQQPKPEQPRGGMPSTGDVASLAPVILATAATASFGGALHAKRRSRK